jgi:sugar/nucleoside kinase (ribokinase family)
MGDILVEVMRKDLDQPLDRPADFTGPYPSGASCIFVDAAARLSPQAGVCGYIGVVGADAFGACVVDRLRDDGVDVAHIRRAPGYTTGIAFVSYRGDGSRNFVFHLPQSAAAELSVDDVPDDYAGAAKFVHVTGSALSINEPARQAIYKAVRLCKAGGGRVSFDPNIRPELLGGMDRLREIVRPVLDACEVLLPSGDEAVLLTGEADAGRACESLIARGIAIVALKRGAQGSVVHTAGGRFGGAFIVGLLEGWDLPRIARFANVAGGLSVLKKGPMEGAPTRAEVLAYL